MRTHLQTSRASVTCRVSVLKAFIWFIHYSTYRTEVQRQDYTDYDKFWIFKGTNQHLFFTNLQWVTNSQQKQIKKIIIVYLIKLFNGFKKIKYKVCCTNIYALYKCTLKILLICPLFLGKFRDLLNDQIGIILPTFKYDELSAIWPFPIGLRTNRGKIRVASTYTYVFLSFAVKTLLSMKVNESRTCSTCLNDRKCMSNSYCVFILKEKEIFMVFALWKKMLHINKNFLQKIFLNI